LSLGLVWDLQFGICNYSGLPLSTGAKKRAATVMVAPLQPKQRVRSESAAGTGTDSVKGKSTLARLAPKRSG
jgi:hypothetical protein